MANKRCYTCKIVKNINKFYKNKHHKDDLASSCKICAGKLHKKYYRKNAIRLGKCSKQWRCKKSSKEYRRRAKLKTKYGITLEDYNRMFQKQKGYCITCNKHQSELTQILVIDHNHKTGKVRGLLCNNCNHALGMVKENITTLENMKQYLKG